MAKKKRYTIYDPNGVKYRVIAKNKKLALAKFIKKVGRGKKTEARSESVVESGWE